MKFTKLSLAAIVAVGALTSVASATPLEDAIKGVEVSGMARYRLYIQDQDTGKAYEGNTTNERHRFSGLLNITSPVTDNIKFGTSLATDNNNYDNAASKAGDVKVNKFWFQYVWNDLSVKAGKFEIPTPWTEAGFAGTRGNGVLAMFTGVEGWAFAAAAYTQTDGHDLAALVGNKNLYALAAIGAVGPVNLQVWANSMEQVIDYALFVEATYAMKGFDVRGQMNYLDLADEIATQDDAGIFYGIEAGYKADNFFVRAGYTQNDKDQPIHALTVENDGFINFGQQLYKISTNTEDAAVYFGKAGMSVNKFGFEAGYGYSTADKALAYDDGFEAYGLVSYAAAKNFGLQLYYSVLDMDGESLDNNELRFEAKYSF